MDVARRLRDEGYRVTPQRQLVWDVLRTADSHLTAEEIHRRVTARAPDVNLASVYRTLALLDDLELVHEVRLGDDRGRWELAHADDVFHLVCTVCGQVDHHEGPLVDEVRVHLDAGHGFSADTVELIVFGTCPACRRGQPSRSTEPAEE